ncbi:hypothetical protein NPIL_344561 [Nephila pilipes]|uniref:Uncharacterized protein n=1 Tax=Nephila pilipes TaxID=299642 RepID=A0A8X6MWZ1_NEPPI|nr:hypothetical protein NPIL_344561 [Nephila pilipes]
MKKRDEERSLILENLRRKLISEPECFSGKNYGHFARDCLYSCTLWGKSGHCRKQCIRKRSEPKNISLSVRDQESFTSNMYSKPAIINGHRVIALLHTGSSNYLLKESIARNLGLNILPYKKDLYLFGNQLNQSLEA